MTLVTDFYFDLPQELIAQHPPAERGASRMLVLSREQGIGIREQRFLDFRASILRVRHYRGGEDRPGGGTPPGA